MIKLVHTEYGICNNLSSFKQSFKKNYNCFAALQVALSATRLLEAKPKTIPSKKRSGIASVTAQS